MEQKYPTGICEECKENYTQIDSSRSCVVCEDRNGFLAGALYILEQNLGPENRAKLKSMTKEDQYFRAMQSWLDGVVVMTTDRKIVLNSRFKGGAV